MSDTVATIHAAMRADAEALRVIGQNIANSSVTAYRRQIPITTAQFAPLLDAALPSSNALSAAVESNVAIDHRPGSLQTTGQPLDLAIEGRGFLVLQGADGVRFTRRGDLRVSSDGLLVAASGEPVLGTSGPIHIGSATPTIDSDGTVRLGTDIVDQLRLVTFEREAGLQYLGNGLFANPGNLTAIEESASTIRQGFLEASNVTPVGEVVQMMETMRHFEAAQRVVRGYDQLMEKAISELGKVG